MEPYFILFENLCARDFKLKLGKWVGLAYLGCRPKLVKPIWHTFIHVSFYLAQSNPTGLRAKYLKMKLYVFS